MIENNWYMNKYSFPVIGISYCRNNSWVNENWCKPPDEIDAWLLDNPAYFVHMQTLVQEGMFATDGDIDGFPYYGDKSNYFPTKAELASIDFGQINVDSNKRGRYL